MVSFAVLSDEREFDRRPTDLQLNMQLKYSAGHWKTLGALRESAWVVPGPINCSPATLFHTSTLNQPLGNACQG